MRKYVAPAVLLLGSFWAMTPVKAAGANGATIECHSRDYQYDECWAGPLSKPQLIHQKSSSPCILNRTWGYNPKSKYIWVAEGCAGVFADVGGYHYGRGDGFDPNARMYNHRGNDTGAVIAGAVLGALLSGVTQSGNSQQYQHTTTNTRTYEGYNGCHGNGCGVDNPDQNIDTRPQFDKNGNPNFDTEGNYQGCHGVGCLVDNPDDPH